MSLFIIFFFLTFLIITIYLYHRLIKSLNFLAPFLTKAYFKVAFIIFISSPTLYMMFTRIYKVHFLIIIFAYLFGIFIITFFAAVLLDLMKLSLKTLCILFKNRISYDIYLPKLKIIWSILFLLYLSFAFYYGNIAPEIKTVNIKIDNFPINKFKVVLLTDLHLGILNREQFLKNVINQTNNESPDIVFLGGDITEAPLLSISTIMELFKDVKSKHGTYAVLGNHEYYHNLNEFIDNIEKNNITLLLNETVQIKDRNKELFNLVGLADPAGFRIGNIYPDFNKASKNIKKSLPTILLSHQTRAIKVDEHNIDLILNGHTHGGQVFPFHLFVKLFHPFFSGTYHLKNNRTKIYVSNGTGYWGPPIRLFAPSEITVINITNK